MEGMTIDTNSVGVKLTYEGQMRRFPFTGTSYAAFYEQVIALLGLEKTAEIVLKYTDEEKDLITISSDLELRSAIVPGQLLRVEAIRKGSAPPAVVQEAPRGVEHFGPSPPLYPFLPHDGAHGAVHQHPPQHGGFQQQHPHPHPPPPFGFHHRGGHGNPPFEHPHPPPFAPGNFGAFMHGSAGGGAPDEETMKKMMKKREKFVKKMGKRHEKMAEFGFPPHHPHPPHHGRHHFGPHPPHCHKKDKKDKKDDKEEKLVARFVADVTVEDGTVFPPQTSFLKTWRVRNEGVAWPTGCKLLFVGKASDNMSAPPFVPIDGFVGNMQEINISVPLVAPKKPGRYTAYFRMCTPEGKKFGQRVWVSINVPPANGDSSSEGEKEADKYEALVDVVMRNEELRSAGFKRHWVFRLVQKYDGDVDKVLRKLEKKMAKQAKKCRKM